MTTRVAFLGLGAMGAPMAARLVRAGYDVTVWNRTAARTEPLAELGAVAAGTPAEAVADAEFVVTMLSDPAAVEAVVEAFADALRADAVLVEMSTVGPDATRRIRDLIPATVGLVDAPVMGSVDRAETGELIVLAGVRRRTWPGRRSCWPGSAASPSAGSWGADRRGNWC
ncbi:NAD(P)-dependent oxidoreductase [Catenulispora yoronensis]